MMIVGIGASAGGLQAIVGSLETFKTVPADICFIVIQHLAPDKKSYMLDILTNKLTLPVKLVETETPLEAGNVYLAPPGKLITLVSQKLILSDIPAHQGAQKNIDHFFKSLALNNLNQCVGVILSGTGTDGLRGCQDLYEAGAEVFIQDPSEAEFDGMPVAVLESGFYTKKIKVKELEEVIFRVLDGKEGSVDHREIFVLIQEKIGFISDFLKEDFGVDLTHYKPGTLLRRISKRMEMLHFKEIQPYLDTLKNDRAERKALFEEIMIPVTSFYRDPEYFDGLSAYLEGSRIIDTDEFRVWVAGCSKGQEAYSLAMLLMEHREKKHLRFSLKIFATDINPANIEYASRGNYHKSELESLPAHLREKYFKRQGEVFTVNAELREALIFSRHDLITSPPFSNLDLVSCRNLLIYLSQKSQKKALTNLLFSLKIGGVLGLGPSETLGEISGSVIPLNQKWRIYKKIKKFQELPLPRWHQPAGQKRIEQSEHITKMNHRNPHKNYSLNLLEALYPHTLFISEDFELLAVFGKAHLLLNKIPSGIMTFSIDQLFNPEIGISITAFLIEARNKQARVRYQGVNLSGEEGEVFNELAIEFVRGKQGLNVFLCQLSS